MRGSRPGSLYTTLQRGVNLIPSEVRVELVKVRSERKLEAPAQPAAGAQLGSDLDRARVLLLDIKAYNRYVFRMQKANSSTRLGSPKKYVPFFSGHVKVAYVTKLPRKRSALRPALCATQPLPLVSFFRPSFKRRHRMGDGRQAEVMYRAEISTH